MSDRHTPGPWRADRHLGCKQIRGRKAGSHRQAQWITEVACTPGLNNESEDLANAILIEAAPKMLEIARRWVALDGGSWNVERLAREKAELLADTNAAIAEATGR